MKFGTALPFVQQMPDRPQWERANDVSALVSIAREADRLGYAWLPCSDHVVVPARAVPSMGDTWYDPVSTLSFVAGQTARIRLLSHVVVLPYHNPLSVAKQYATLDHLSNGRVILGVGAGHLRSEFRALGASYDDRGPATDECIRIIKAVWTSTPASYHGDRFDFSGLHLSPRPLQQPHPPIWVGGNSLRAARRAVELADGWVPFELTLRELRDRLAFIELALVEKPDPFDVVLPAGVQLTARPVDRGRATFHGSAEQVIEDIRTLLEEGATGLTIGFRAASLGEYIERMQQFAETVMTAF
jgi:probable F420-dependent oxidoreductase